MFLNVFTKIKYLGSNSVLHESKKTRFARFWQIKCRGNDLSSYLDLLFVLKAKLFICTILASSWKYDKRIKEAPLFQFSKIQLLKILTRVKGHCVGDSHLNFQLFHSFILFVMKMEVES